MLTQKQESFCLAYVETGNTAEAYRRAYDCSKMKPESIHRKAKDLMDNGKIAARLDELRAPVRERAQLTLESHLARLDYLSRKAEEAEQYSPAIAAEVSRGKAAGLYVERKEVTGRDGAPLMPTQILLVAAGTDDDDGDDTASA